MGCGYGGKKSLFLGGMGRGGREWDARFEIYIYI